MHAESESRYAPSRTRTVINGTSSQRTARAGMILARQQILRVSSRERGSRDGTAGAGSYAPRTGLLNAAFLPGLHRGKSHAPSRFTGIGFSLSTSTENTLIAPFQLRGYKSYSVVSNMSSNNRLGLNKWVFLAEQIASSSALHPPPYHPDHTPAFLSIPPPTPEYIPS